MLRQVLIAHAADARILLIACTNTPRENRYITASEESKLILRVIFESENLSVRQEDIHSARKTDRVTV